MNQPDQILAAMACVVSAAAVLLAAFLTHCTRIRPEPQPARGDAVEQWLRAQRDVHSDKYGVTPAWFILDDLLNLYRLHADTATPLDQHCCEGNGCDCLEVAP